MPEIADIEQINNFMRNLNHTLTSGNLWQAKEDVRRFIREYAIPEGSVELLDSILNFFLDWIHGEQRKVEAGDDEDAEDRYSATIPMFSGFLKDFLADKIEAQPADQELVVLSKKTVEFAKLAFDACHNFTGEKDKLMAAFHAQLLAFFSQENPLKNASYYLIVKVAVTFLEKNKQFLSRELLRTMMPDYNCFFEIHSNEVYPILLHVIRAVDKLQDDEWKKDAQLNSENAWGTLRSDKEVYMILVSALIFEFDIPHATRLMYNNVTKIVSTAVKNLMYSRLGENDNTQEQCFLISTVMRILDFFNMRYACDIQQSIYTTVVVEKLDEKKEFFMSKTLIDVEVASLCQPLWNTHNIQWSLQSAAQMFLHEPPNGHSDDAILQFLETVTPRLNRETFTDDTVAGGMSAMMEQILLKESDPSSDVGIAKKELQEALQSFQANIPAPPVQLNELLGRDPSAPGTSNDGNGSGGQIDNEVITLSDSEHDEADNGQNSEIDYITLD